MILESWPFVVVRVVKPVSPAVTHSCHARLVRPAIQPFQKLVRRSVPSRGPVKKKA
ncbi:hypothetical protein [Kitasatospora terrestris]|uniref:hypothetical protein n=1 Tax=Kitasatospora terrestris TaxID=258051 RepID=UPI0031E8F0CD